MAELRGLFKLCCDLPNPLPGRFHVTRFRMRLADAEAKRVASVEDGVQWIQALCDTLAVPGLGEFGVTEADFAEIVAKSQVSSSMKGNPLPLTDEELVDILEKAL